MPISKQTATDIAMAYREIETAAAGQIAAAVFGELARPATGFLKSGLPEDVSLGLENASMFFICSLSSGKLHHCQIASSENWNRVDDAITQLRAITEKRFTAFANVIDKLHEDGADTATRKG